MQRMHLRKLQIRLVKHAVYMYKDGREAENSTWEKDLAEYSRLQTVIAGLCHTVKKLTNEISPSAEGLRLHDGM